MSTPFTAGPWKFCYHDDARRIETQSGESLVVDTQYYPYVNATDADLCLMAAAPDLYEALKRTLHHPLHGTTDIEKERAYWEYEKTQGRGEADDMLFALAALDKAVPA